MTILKRVITYSIWTIIAFIFAIGYTLIILRFKPKIKGNLQFLIDLFYMYGFIYIGSIIGSIIGALFIITDAVYLNKRLKNNKNPTMIRLTIIAAITITVGIIHYILEKVIDVI